MKYKFRGRLCGWFCHDCHEPLAGIKVRIYKVLQTKDLPLLAVADPTQTFHEVSAEELKEKNKNLLSETILDANGDFVFELDEKSGYKGEAFDFEFVCGTGYGKPKPPKKEELFQFHITTIQPQWRESEDGKERIAQFRWEYCIPNKWWCRILQKIDRWVICGRVTDCESGIPAAGVKVFAFDVDLIQDDPLGSAYTDAGGYFRIIYSSADFSKTIFSWLNIEWPAGPDLYFRVETASAQVLLAEPRSTGHRHDRANAHNCFCVKLCVKYNPVDQPWFTHIGNYNITSDIDPSGLTINNRSFASGVGFGFYDYVKLVGYATKKVPTDLTKALHYRFVFSLDGINYNPVTEIQTFPGRLKVGVRQIIWNGVTAFQDIVIDPTQPASVADSIPIDTFPALIPDHVLRQDANGWIRVDQVGLDNGFYGPLLRVNTNILVPGGSAQDMADQAGNAAVNPRNGKKVFFAFQTTDDPTNTASPNFREQSIKGLAYVNNWNELRMLKLDELVPMGGGSGCNQIASNAHVHYTADHELLAGWNLYVNSAAMPGGITILEPDSSGTAPRGNTDNFDFATPGTVAPAFATWLSCSYRLGITTRRKLTNGEDNDLGSTTEITFCR